MSKKKDEAALRPDEDNPEWTREEIRAARPASEVIAEAFGPAAVEAYRREGPGWQVQINTVQRKHMPRHGK